MKMYSNKLIACVKANGKVLREKGEEVYLPFGSEYTLWFKNEHKRKVQINVEIDGTDVLFGKSLLLSSGETMDLKGFVREMNGDENRAFRFITKTQEISDFRGDKIEDGLIKISYQFERESRAPSIDFNQLVDHYHYNHHKWNNDCIYRGNNDYGSINCSDVVGSDISMANVAGSYSSNVTATASASISPQGAVPLKAVKTNNVLRNVSSEVSDDPGITVEGSATGQDFHHGYIGSLESKTHSIMFQLKGLTANEEISKPVTVKSKKQCPSCGKKLKSSFEYCPHDGTFLRFN
jgi:hypothetical protein